MSSSSDKGYSQQT